MIMSSCVMFLANIRRKREVERCMHLATEIKEIRGWHDT